MGEGEALGRLRAEQGGVFLWIILSYAVRNWVVLCYILTAIPVVLTQEQAKPRWYGCT